MVISADLPRLPERFVYRLDLAQAATPRLLRKRPVHRWFWFPHSYSPELVEAVLQQWKLPPGGFILDPFVGAGTTLVVAKQHGYSAIGTDLSPLAVLVSRVKVGRYDSSELETTLDELRRRWDSKGDKLSCVTFDVSPRIQRAFTSEELAVLMGLRQEIMNVKTEPIRDFLLVALLSIVPEFSRARADGGWFRWVERPNQADRIAATYWQRVEEMIRDVASIYEHNDNTWQVFRLDARSLHHLKPRLFDGLITSPPYANRHDYSRVFQIELLLMGYGESDISSLRYQSLRSHVEARPPVEDDNIYTPPPLLTRSLKRLPGNIDNRVRRMMEGYFHDMFLVLRSAKHVLKPRARIAMVVGNVRHGGVLFPVDEILVSLFELAGYRFRESWVIRLRGNSAQQMGLYGRIASRETVVIAEN